MASAYKWRITNTKYAYLATPTSDEPVISFIVNGFTADDEVKIAQRVNGYSETTYSTQYNILKELVAADSDGARLTMLSYKYYYDIDETSCGFANESIGPQGIQGTQGIQGIQGLSGNDGVGIDYIYTGTTASITSGFRVYIRLTNGVEYYFDVVNGQDGLPASIDYDRITSAITALNIGEQISGATSEYLIEQLSHLYGREIVNIREILQSYSGIMSTLSADTGSVQAQVLYGSGITRQLWEYYNTQDSSITQIYQEFNAYSGVVGQMVENVDLVSSAVTELESGYFAVSGMLYDYVTRTDALTGDMSGLTRSYNTLHNSFQQAIFDITRGGDSGNPFVELSQIYQSSNTISAVTTNSDGLAAGLILCINEGTSEALITAKKLKLQGEDIKLGSIIEDTEHYHSEFFANGSGYLANGNISWTSGGTMTINGEVVANAASGVTMRLGGENGVPSAIFNADGSGFLANGNISWDISGNTQFQGVITALGGTIGGFTINDDYLEASNSMGREVTLSSNLLSFYDWRNTKNKVAIGADVMPDTMGGANSCPMRIEVKRTDDSSVPNFYSNIGISIDVTGVKSSDVEGQARTGNHALYIENGDICGFRMRVRRVSDSQTLSSMDSVILAANSEPITLKLPSDPKEGQIYLFKLIGNSKYTIEVGDADHRINDSRANRKQSWEIDYSSIVIVIWDRVNKIWQAGFTDHN